MSGYEHHEVEGGAALKMWTKGVAVDDGAITQMEKVAKLPIIHNHVAAMPDCHWGMGATVGSVIPTKGAIIPAAVGVDIGCGMMAWKLTLSAKNLPDNLGTIRSDIERGTAWFCQHQRQGPQRWLAGRAELRRLALAQPRATLPSHSR